MASSSDTAAAASSNNNNTNNASVSPLSCHRLPHHLPPPQTTKRAGWVKREVQNPESISDHMYRMGLMALISSDIPAVNRDKYGVFLCVKMATVHDMAEVCMDNGPGGFSVEANQIYEERTRVYYTIHIHQFKRGHKRVEMILQAWEYEKEHGKDLEEFFTPLLGNFRLISAKHGHWR